MSVVVSGDGSPVSPETNIICGIGNVSLLLSRFCEGPKELSEDAEPDFGDDGDVENAMITVC